MNVRYRVFYVPNGAMPLYTIAGYERTRSRAVRHANSLRNISLERGWLREEWDIEKREWVEA